MQNHRKGQQVGSRAFRCGYKGCGRLYTTAHHLKVKQVTWQCAGQSCPRLHCQSRMLHCVQLSYMLSPPRDPDVSIGQGEIQQGTSHSLHQHFSTVFLLPCLGPRFRNLFFLFQVHERAHTGDRPYTCDFPSCGKAFATGNNFSFEQILFSVQPNPC